MRAGSLPGTAPINTHGNTIYVADFTMPPSSMMAHEFRFRAGFTVVDASPHRGQPPFVKRIRRGISR